MGLEFKHLIYVAALACVFWAVAVSGLIAFDGASDSIEIKGELTYDRSGTFLNNFDKLGGVEMVLNVVLPTALLCIAYLVYTYKINPIGLGSILLIVLGFLFAADSILSARDAVERDFKVEMSQRVWWMGD